MTSPDSDSPSTAPAVPDSGTPLSGGNSTAGRARSEEGGDRSGPSVAEATALLCAALRSGRYKQGRFGLRVSGPGGDDDDCFCILGVTCDVLAPFVDGVWADRDPWEFGIPAAIETAGDPVDERRDGRVWLAKTTPGAIDRLLGWGESDVVELTNLNDMGDEFDGVSVTFAELADRIEAGASA